MTLVTRFAPSPTGYLHMGHVMSAVKGWRLARQAGGRFLLRIEDIDRTRCRPEFTQAILEDLEWLGIAWDGEARVQSRHLGEYDTVLRNLRGRGLLYRCFCSRADIARAGAAPHGPEGPVYPGTCRALGEAASAARADTGAAFAWRLDMAAALRAVGSPLRYTELGQGEIECGPAASGDVVLARRDVAASYHLCVTHDDALQGVTLVTRGEDLAPATGIHRVLQALMGWQAPVYAHHPLLRGADGKRLAKRDGAESVRAMRARGMRPQDVLAQISA